MFPIDEKLSRKSISLITMIFIKPLLQISVSPQTLIISKTIMTDDQYLNVLKYEENIQINNLPFGPNIWSMFGLLLDTKNMLKCSNKMP